LSKPETVLRQPHIAILLSTYNGTPFLAEQLESFLTQDYGNWVLHWRDDGSSDETVSMMRDFASRVGPERCVESRSSGPHMGAAKSFLALLSENLAAEAVAFADQDDVWLSHKLSRAACAMVDAGETPALYCARQILVDEALRGAVLSAMHRDEGGFPASLTQNIANGNTLVMNASAASLVATMGLPEGTVHDWWSYIVVSACGGRVIFDERPGVLYRLHKNNLIASAGPVYARAMAALKRGSRIFMTMMHRHAETLAQQPNRLTPQARRDLRLIQEGLEGGLAAKLLALQCPRFRRRTALENVLFFYWFVTDGLTTKSARRNAARRQTVLPAWAPKENTVSDRPRIF
jgi:glycosyltransferase involved in cell wall biosynthesis